MCGRYSLSRPDKLAGLIAEVAVLPPDFVPLAPRYNIAPSQTAPVIIEVEARRELVLLRWGLVPFWANDEAGGPRMINARAESLAGKPALQRLQAHRRCLVPADGFYEWRRAGKLKLPVRFTLEDGGIFAFAGLWDRWVRPEGGGLETFTIITTRANELVSAVHGRMPAMIPSEHWQEWMEPATGAARWKSLLEPFPASAMRMHDANPLLNSPAVDSLECLTPPPPPAESQLGFGF
jgi:putative SOS response-associated peptidase YedK